VFHVKDYLTPKDLSEKGLAPSLDAMEVRDFTTLNPVAKKRLLRILWRDSPFEARFGKYIQRRGKHVVCDSAQCYGIVGSALQMASCL